MYGGSVNIENIEIEYNMEDKDSIIDIVKVLVIYNAIQLGWKVKKIDEKSFEFKKEKSKITNFNLENFVDTILSYH